MIEIIEYAFIFLVLHFVLNLIQDKKDKIKIKKLKEEIEHERYNHERQLNRNIELILERDMLKRKYQDMVIENLRLKQELKKLIIGG